MTENYIGDLLVQFQGEDNHPPTRTPEEHWITLNQYGTWSLLVSPTGPQWKGFPLVATASGSWQVWLLGELINCSKPSLQPFLLSVVNGAIPAGDMNGHFLLIAWNSQAFQWHIWTDRFGTLHAYHATDRQCAAFGTFSPAVAGAASQRKLDWAGLAGFFSFGFFPQDRTYFQDVKILRPASHYIFDQDGQLLSQERYWRWRHEPDPKRSYDDTVAEFASLFETILADQTRDGCIALPISGGLDSRSTVAAIAHPGKHEAPCEHFWSYSYGYSDESIETRIARQVAAARQLPFQAITIRPYLFDRVEQLVSWTEGFQDITQCRQASVRDQIAANADYLIAALWGDVWLDDMGLVGEPAELLDNDHVLLHAQKKIQKSGGNWLLEHLVAPHLKKEQIAGLLKDFVQTEMEALQDIADPDFRVKAFKTEQWSFRWSQPPLRVFQSAAFPRLVFYDARLADFFCTVPSAFLSGRRLQIDYLKRFAPDLARITWQPYDANLYHYQHFRTWLLPKRAVKKAQRLLTGQKVLERNWEVQFLCESGRIGLRHWLLRSGLRLHEFISPKSLQELVDSFYVKPIPLGYTVCMLLSFSAWLELYG